MNRLATILLVLLCCLVGVNSAEAKTKRKLPPSPYRIEVSMREHRLYVYKNGQLEKSAHISGGGEYLYPKYGRRWSKKRHRWIRVFLYKAKAHTPRGEFTVLRRQKGPHKSDLGMLYNPLYFTESGYAIHGSYSVPGYHASHGCIRVAMRTSRWLLRTIPIGTVVVVR